MTNIWMSHDQIVMLHKQSSDKSKQVTILAECNLTSEEVIHYIIERAQRKKCPIGLNTREALHLQLSGASLGDIAFAQLVPEAVVKKWDEERKAKRSCRPWTERQQHK